MKYIFLVVCFFCATNVMAQENEKREVEFGVELTSELQATDNGNYRSTMSGDACQSMNFVNLLRLDVSLPVSSSISLDAASLSTYMTADESIGGDLQTFSNLDAGTIPFALSVCNVAWKINDHHALFAGIRNMNLDYFTSPATSLFTNSSCGIFPTISANYPIANYPVASVGIHYKYDDDDDGFDKLTNRDDDDNDDSSTGSGQAPDNDGGRFGFQASLYNGMGYNRFTGRNNIFRVCPKDDGVFGIAEVSYTRGGSRYFLGNALYLKEGVSATPWFYTEQSIFPELTLLACCSHAFSTRAECKDFIGLGALYKLGKCQLGAFTDYVNFMERKEFATELTCKIPVCQHMDIQPTAHIITYEGRSYCIAALRMSLLF